MKHYPPEAISRLKNYTALLAHERAGQRLIGAKAASELIAEMGLTWANVVEAAFGSPVGSTQKPQAEAEAFSTAAPGAESGA